jgi:ABC-2 type transport system permease protein
MLLMGMFYLSIGCLASVLTRNQIIAAVISFAAITLIFFSGLLSFIVLNVTPAFRDFVGYFSAIEHMGEFSKGIVDTRPMIYYLSMTTLVLMVTHQILQSRKWRA